MYNMTNNIDVDKLSKMSDAKKRRYLSYFTEDYTTCECCDAQLKLKNYTDHITRKCTRSDWHKERIIIWRCRH